MQRSTHRAWWLMGLLLGVALVGSAKAQREDAAWCKAHLRGNRCEGFRDKPNAGEEFEVLGFYRGFAPFPLQSDTVLHVTYFDPAAGEKAFIKVQEVHDYLHYLMEAERKEDEVQGWNTFRPWPAADVLLTRKMEVGNLGVVVKLETPDGSVLSPAILGSSPGHSVAATYALYFQVGVPLAELTYTVSGSGFVQQCVVREANEKACGKTEKLSSEERSLANQRRLGLEKKDVVGVLFTIPSATGKNNETVTVTFHGRRVNSNAPYAPQFRFVHSTL